MDWPGGRVGAWCQRSNPAPTSSRQIENLNEQGFPAAVHYYPKDQTASYLSSCAPTGTTIQYKSLTRQRIESQG